MINFDSASLKTFVEENVDFITGSRIQKIQQPTRRELVFSLRNNGETRKFYINITPEFYHLCFMSKDNEAKRLIEIPKSPPMFCMLLRKYLENSRITKVIQPEYERILELYIETYNEFGEKIFLCFAIELMGKHSNVVLYNYDTNMIIGCAHNVGAEKSREREMAGGLPYIYPPRKNDYWYKCKNSFENGDINEKIDAYYANLILADKFKKLQDRYRLLTCRKLKKIENSYSQMIKQNTLDEKLDKYRLYGDLIMANLYDNKDFSEKIEVYNYTDNNHVIINLDINMTLKENANRFYKLYNKSKNANSKLFELIEKNKSERDYLNQLLYSIENAQNMMDLLEVASEIEVEKKNIKTDKSAILPREIIKNGSRIFIGKNNKQNDYIISKLKKDDDIWFHTKNCAGSHVLLRGENPSAEIILECAQIAKENSSGKNSTKVGVIYTKAKYLKKPPKANLGYVTYSREKEIVVE